MWTTKTITIMLLSGIASVGLVGQASALEAQAFVDRVANVLNDVGYDITFGTATLNGDTVTVDGVTVGIKAYGETAKPMHFADEITFSGVSELDDGGYHADAVTIPDIATDFAAATDPKGHLSLKDIRMDDIVIPGGTTVSAVQMMQLYSSFSTGPLSVLRDGAEVLSYEGFEAGSTFNPADVGAELIDLSSSFSISNIKADLSSVGDEDPSAGAVIEALDLTHVNGNITGDMSWSMADGAVSINQLLLDFADIGSLDLTAQVTGFTPAVLDQIYAMQAKSAAGGEMTDEKAQAQMMSAMAIMQGVSIVGASVRYDDASMAGKLLDFFAKQSDADRATFVEGLKSVLPAIVAESGIPALADIVVPPVSTFLDDPQSLEVRIAPPSPTSALVLMAAAANPAGLIKALGLSVMANTPADDADE